MNTTAKLGREDAMLSQPSRENSDDNQSRARKSSSLHAEGEKARVSAMTEPLMELFKVERARIVPPDVQRQLKERAESSRLPPDASKEDRLRRSADQRAFAKELGIDLAALDRLRADIGRQFARITAAAPYHGDVYTEIAGGEGSATRPPQLRNLEFDGWWDGGISWYSSRASKFAVWNAESYHNQVGRTGSNIKFRQSETDDFDTAYMTSHGGYMRLFNTDGARI